MIEFRTELKKASKLKYQKKFREALEIYEKQYGRHPDKFNTQQKRDFAWVIFNVHIKNHESEEELLRHAEFVTKLVGQMDMRNRDLACPYTSTVFEMLKYYGSKKDYNSMISWFEKIKVECLNPFPFTKFNRRNKSKREVFLDFASNAYYALGYYEECIEACKSAIDTIDDILDDYWLYWRCGKALKQLNCFKEAIPYLKKAVNAKPSRFLYKDIAECYYLTGENNEALKYVCPVIFDDASDNEKIGIYYLAYKILRKFNPQQALNHAKFYYLLNRENGNIMPYDIRQMELNESELDKNQLKSEIMEIWTRYREYLRNGGA